MAISGTRYIRMPVILNFVTLETIYRHTFRIYIGHIGDYVL